MLDNGIYVLKFQVFDADYTYDDSGKPVLRFYGRDKEGSSVCCFVPDFKPYFYLKTDFDVRGRLLAKFEGIVLVEEIQRFPPVGYFRDPILMYRVVVSDPKNVPEIRDAVGEFGEVFETDILFRNRFMVDHGIGGMSWVRVQEEDTSGIRVEGVDCDKRVVGQLAPVDAVSNVQLRYLAFDIECLTSGGMPNPKTSPIILISFSFKPAYRGLDSLVLVAKPAKGRGVEGCRDEVELLKRFCAIVRDFDPDVIFGYNSNGFDFPYIVDRVKHLGLDVKLDIGRDGKPVYYRRIGTTSRVSVTGRIIADVLPIIRREFSLKQYTLRNTAKELLGMEKHDVGVEMMAEYWEDKSLLPIFIEYCRNDSHLAMEMMMRYRLLDKHIALARISGSLLQDILDSGQSAMIENILLGEYRANERVMPSRPNEKLSSRRKRMGEKLKGGEVLEPEHGLLENIVILDYRSLYPSIMMAHNLCYTTEIKVDEPDDTVDVITTPSGARFVSRNVQRGIVPQVLERLLEQRVEIKKRMESTAGAEELHVLDATQLALKILLNSFYGYSGYARARLHSLNLANSVTSYGRENILHTKKLIEEELESCSYSVRTTSSVQPEEITPRIENGGKRVFFEVVYGDTDSVFVRLNTNDDDFLLPRPASLEETRISNIGLDEAGRIGEDIARVVTSSLEEPMELVFEAFARRAIFLAKKRYAIWVFEKSGGGWDDSIKVKGMETVRRDWCELASGTLERVLELVLKKGNIEEAVEHVRGVVKDIRRLMVEHDPEITGKLVITRRYTKKAENYHNKQPHITVVGKIKKRGGKVPEIGDRVPFIITAGSGLLVERAEDAEYVMAHNVPVDTDYYIHKQVLPPVERIFKSLGVNTKRLDTHVLCVSELVDRGSQKSLFDSFR